MEVLSVLLLGILVQCTSSSVIIYPSPHGIQPSDKFHVSISQNGHHHNLFVYISKSDHRHAQFPRAESGRSMSWTSFAFTGAAVTVKVQTPTDFHNCVVKPTNYGYKCKRTGSKAATFIVTHNTRMMSVEFDYDYGLGVSDIVDKLFVFADPPEGKVPSPQDKNVLYYGPGLHDLHREIVVDKDIREVYIAPGAYIKGGFQLPHGHVKFHGRGIISNENFVRHDARIGQAAVNFQRSSYNTFDGVTIVDPSQFYYMGNGDDNVVRNARLVAAWMYNSDGIGIGDRGLVEDSFIIADDANIKIHKSHMTVRRCVLWQMQNGGVFQTGWETAYVRNVSISDMDVIHVDYCKFKGPCTHFSSNDAVLDTFGNTRHFDISDLRFEDIRIEGSCPRVVNFVMDPAAKGTISNIKVINMSVETQPTNDPIHNSIAGTSIGGRITNWQFVNLKIGGHCISNPIQGDFRVDPHTTKDITFSCHTDPIIG
ncbi:dextranase-like [Haliotis asinina]|uniref:dextranase-like n=1 Tax=Haliotis asinina TaxID=109174 RepID=UPI0035326DD9